jgi:hypothetical protein
MPYRTDGSDPKDPAALGVVKAKTGEYEKHGQPKATHVRPIPASYRGNEAAVSAAVKPTPRQRKILKAKIKKLVK